MASSVQLSPSAASAKNTQLEQNNVETLKLFLKPWQMMAFCWNVQGFVDNQRVKSLWFFLHRFPSAGCKNSVRYRKSLFAHEVYRGANSAEHCQMNRQSEKCFWQLPYSEPYKKICSTIPKVPRKTCGVFFLWNKSLTAGPTLLIDKPKPPTPNSPL